MKKILFIIIVLLFMYNLAQTRDRPSISHKRYEKCRMEYFIKHKINKPEYNNRKKINKVISSRKCRSKT